MYGLKVHKVHLQNVYKNSWRDSDLQIPNAGLFAASSIEWPSTFYAYLFLCSLVIQALKKVLWLLCF